MTTMEATLGLDTEIVRDVFLRLISLSQGAERSKAKENAG